MELFGAYPDMGNVFWLDAKTRNWGNGHKFWHLPICILILGQQRVQENDGGWKLSELKCG